MGRLGRVVAAIDVWAGWEYRWDLRKLSYPTRLCRSGAIAAYQISREHVSLVRALAYDGGMNFIDNDRELGFLQRFDLE